MIVCVAAEDSGCGWQNFRKHCLHLLTHHHLLSNHWRVCRKLLVFSQRSTLTPSFLCPLFPSFKFLLLQLDPIQTVPVVCRNLCNQPCLVFLDSTLLCVGVCVCVLVSCRADMLTQLDVFDKKSSTQNTKANTLASVSAREMSIWCDRRCCGHICNFYLFHEGTKWKQVIRSQRITGKRKLEGAFIFYHFKTVFRNASPQLGSTG